MSPFKIAASLLPFLPLLVLTTLPACTESAKEEVLNDLAAEDGGSPRPSGSNNGPDAGAADPVACAEEPTAPTGSAFCDEVGKRGNALGTATCKTDAAYCLKQQAIYSEAYKSQYVTCSKSTAFCGPAFSACRSKLTAIAPTAAQAKVATSFCSTCGGGSATCAADFFTATAKRPSPGYSTLLASDAVAAKIQAECTGTQLNQHFDAGAPLRTPELCTSAFVGCAMDVARAAAPLTGCPK